MYDVVLPTARDCMTKNVLTFTPDDDVFEAMAKLLENHFAAAPVVDEDGKALGMLTEKDCLRSLSNFTYDDIEGGKVDDFQSPLKVICRPEMDIFGVTDHFLDTNFPLLAVCEDDKLVGVISRRDTLRGVLELRRRLDLARRKLEETAGRQSDRPRGIESMQRTAASQSPAQLTRLMGRKS
ncbi:MAG: CBS domain-containing protein [bacterium]|nr:CBS domain-containing protein [bacterium]